MLGSGPKATRATPAPPPTSSRPPCSLRSGMAQSSYRPPSASRPKGNTAPGQCRTAKQGICAPRPDESANHYSLLPLMNTNPREPGASPAAAGACYKVRVSKDYLVFCAGHYITYGGGECERLQGHNYRAAVEMEGDLDENSYVFDFIALKDMTREITDELDHRMLLPTQSNLIRLVEEGKNWRVCYGDRSWSFPQDECA